jgi:uncharacterized OB-fold protein
VSSTEPITAETAIRLEQQITLQYRFAAGKYATRFFEALRDEGKILGTRDAQGNVMVPPRPINGLTSLPMEEWVEVGPGGTLAGCTIVYVPFIDPMTGQQRPVPYGFGLIQFDGADTNIYHLLDETDPEKIGVGKRVEAVFKPKEERVGNLADIRHFRLVD